jgi:anti-sigma28 factor (negative regulator of flagellin synthesis)
MKIEPQNIQPNNGAGANQQTGGAQQADQVSSGRSLAAFSRNGYGLGTDSVQLSSLSAAVQAYTSGSPERTSALNQIGKDVQTGRYQINNQAVSQSIIAEAQIH